MALELFWVKLAFSFFLVCFSNGAPTGSGYSHQEEDLVMKELENHVHNYNTNTWHIVAEAHEKLREAKAPGFSTKRTARALQKRFGRAITDAKIFNMPRNVKQHYAELFDKRYSSQERAFINGEIATLQGKLWVPVTWKEIIKKHDAKRESGCPGFERKRTWCSLRSYFRNFMIPRGLIDEAVKQRFPGRFKARQGPTSTEEASQSKTGKRKSVCQRYTREEDEFIVKELESHANTYDGGVTWKLISEAHRRKVEEETYGFPTARSDISIRQHFIDVIIKSEDIEIPDTVKEIYYTILGRYFSLEEQTFINAQLLSWQGSLYGPMIWKQIKAGHDEKRKSGCAGFNRDRTWSNLRTHFKKVMVPKGLVHEDIKRRYPKYFTTEQAEWRHTATGASGHTNSYFFSPIKSFLSQKSIWWSFLHSPNKD